MSVTFKLRKNAKFHDGTPVTAKDVKWSFDRAVTVGGFPTFQMKAGSLEKPEQFVAVDDYTFRVDFLRKDKLTMMDMAVPVPSIFNSEEVKKHATKEDPWALGWTKANVAGGGAYKLESWKPGQEIIYARYDDWKSGKLPKIKRIVQRDIPSAGNRRALMEKGDIDITYEMPPKDFAEWAQEKKNIQVFSTPIENALWYIGMNVTKPPFNNPKVRQAVAYAIPYDKIMENAMYKRATAMCGDKDNKASGVNWPQPTGYKYDIVKARALMKEAGMEAGFETTLSFDLGGATVGEPACVLLVGVAGADRHQGEDREDSRLELARAAAEEGHADDPQPLRRLAELPGVLLLLVLPLAGRGVQHHVLQEPGDGQADRGRALRHRSEEVPAGRARLHQHGFR